MGNEALGQEKLGQAVDRALARIESSGQEELSDEHRRYRQLLDLACAYIESKQGDRYARAKEILIFYLSASSDVLFLAESDTICRSAIRAAIDRYNLAAYNMAIWLQDSLAVANYWTFSRKFFPLVAKCCVALLAMPGYSPFEKVTEDGCVRVHVNQLKLVRHCAHELLSHLPEIPTKAQWREHAMKFQGTTKFDGGQVVDLPLCQLIEDALAAGFSMMELAVVMITLNFARDRGVKLSKVKKWRRETKRLTMVRQRWLAAQQRTEAIRIRPGKQTT